ncbi:MAG: hypothetical protein KDA92_16250 [Planctomycetales bacterium]|nr:hypothetical protein [Planctomycetales bacterium]
MTLQAQFRRWPLGAGAIIVALLGVAWCVAQEFDLPRLADGLPAAGPPRSNMQQSARGESGYSDGVARWVEQGEVLPSHASVRPRVPDQPVRYVGPAMVGGPHMRVRTRARVVLETYQEEVPAEELQRRNRWRELANQIRQTEAAEERQVLGEELKGVLSEIFDEDMKQREASLAELEQRVAKLRESLDGRKENRDRIIGLQLDSVLLEAAGLSFPGAPQAYGQELGGWRNDEHAGQTDWATPGEPAGRAVPRDAAPENLPRPTLTVH